MTTTRRLAVIVLGMHRSGTSAVAGTAVRLGLAPPRTMLPPSADNPAGFYESDLIASLNQWVLLKAGCDWHDCLTFDTNRLGDQTWATARDLSLGALREEFGDAPAFLIKDPRLCLTLPIWLPGLRAAGVEVAVLLAVRHPNEVVESLSRRDRLPETVTAPLWLHYTLEAERATRSLPRAVVAYDELLCDWRGCMARAGRAAGITWPAGPELDRPDVDAFLDRSFRHHVTAHGSAAVGPPPVRGLMDLTWSAFRQLQSDPVSPFALEWLDQARTTFAARRLACAADQPNRADGRRLVSARR